MAEKMQFLQSDCWRNVDDTGDPGSFVRYLNLVEVTIREARAEIIRLLEVSPGCSVLDVGSGAGDFLIELATSVDGVRAVGVDASQTMVTTAISRALAAGVTVQFSLGDVQQLDYLDESFDRVNCSRILVHVEDAQAAIAEMARVLIPGGRIAILEPDFDAMVVNTDDPGVAAAVRRRLVGSLRNPDIGRRLPGLLLDNGFHQPELSRLTLDLDIVNHFDNLSKVEIVTAEEADQWRKWFNAASHSDRIVVSLGAVRMLATKPPP
jgi:SAM-dependent methyltransferase